MRRTLAIALTLSIIAPAAAQQVSPLLPPPGQPWPRTINITSNKTKESLGTATYSDNRIYLRDTKNEHYATIVIGADGKQTAYDPHGKIIQMPAVPAAPQ